VTVPAIVDPISLRAELGEPAVLADYLTRPGVLRTGHFRLLSGLHSDHFIAFSQLAKDEAALESIASLLLPTVGAWSPDAVLAPSTAGVMLGSTLARRLGAGFHLATLDDLSRPDGIVGDTDLSGARVVLVNDVVTTGQSFEALASVAATSGASVAGAAWFASRSAVDVPAAVGAPGAFALSLDLPAVKPQDCRACAKHEPLEDGIDLN